MKFLLNRLALLIWLQIGSVFFITRANAQITSELGFGLGGINYKGEVSPAYRFGNNKPALTLFYRRDVSAPITLKGSILLGVPGARDTAYGLPLNNFRQVDMSGFLAEAAVGFEYNFLDFHDITRRTRWTPYFFLDIAAYYLSVSTESSQGAIIAGNQPSLPVIQVSEEVNRDNSFFSVAIPVGVGIKYALSYHWNLGLEVGARKIFTDEFDNLGETVPSAALVNPNDSDWYFYNGLTLSYTFYKLKCPKVYRQQPSPLD